MQPATHSGTENTTHTPEIRPAGLIINANVRQALLRASKKDCNDSRNRFIPRAKLLDIINAELVGQFLQTFPEAYTNDASHREHVVQLISPGPGKCSCGRKYCTGRRMILAALFLCGREDLILSFLPPADHQTCDRSLPLRLDSDEDHCYGLSTEERELFIHFQWHVYTPFLTVITSGESKNVAALPEEVSLPWMETTRVGDKEFGEVSYVERIEIHNLNHDLGTNNVFALKTFEQRLVAGMSENRFRSEVDANLQVPEHERIVRLLTAFSYRERFCLVFPLATEGSLEKLWKAYIPDGVDQLERSTPARLAHWYSDDWLVGECLAIADAVLATHALLDDHPEGPNGVLHADIKPANILCFSQPHLGQDTIVLKLADFGEAKRVKPNVDLMAGKVAHVKTYRPPEHAPGNIITLNYDVWCLGCLFLDFVTWAIHGQPGIDSFVEDREKEQDEAAVTENPGQIIEDKFFKRTKQEFVPVILKRLHWGHNSKMKVESGRATTTHSLWAASHVNITSRLKDAVVTHLTSLQQHARCSDQLKRLVSFIGEKMLVVDPKKRADSREVRRFLKMVVEGG